MSKILITQIKSINNANKKQIATIEALGLKKIGQTVEHEDTPNILGMVNRVSHMVRCEEA